MTSCEEYFGWMTEAALGALPAARAGELRAHASRCEACRSEWEAVSALVAALDRAAAALVAGEPLPQFAARLRARIAEEPAPSAWLLPAWPRLAAALAAAAALLAVLVVRSPERTSRGTAPVTNRANAVAASRAAGAEPAAHHAAAPLSRAPRRAAGDRHGRARFAEPEVLVPKGQLSAAFVLADAVNSGTIAAAQLSASAVEEAKPIELKPLEIAPLALPALDAAADTGALERPGH